MDKSEKTQEMIDGLVPDQYLAIGRLHQLGFVFEHLKKNSTDAVDLFSGYDEEDHVPFLAAVQVSLEHIITMEEALRELRTVLMWMRARRSEIFNENDDE